jgi:hypothetical protein
MYLQCLYHRKNECQVIDLKVDDTIVKTKNEINDWVFYLTPDLHGVAKWQNQS